MLSNQGQLGYSYNVPPRIRIDYFTLFITPMTLVSGVFFPTDQLPGWIALIGGWLPLAQGVALVRPLLAGEVPANALIHIMALLVTAAVAFVIALHLTRRRLLK